MYLSIDLPIYHQPIHPAIHSPTHPPNHLPIHSFINPNYQSIYLYHSSYPSTHQPIFINHPLIHLLFIYLYHPPTLPFICINLALTDPELRRVQGRVVSFRSKDAPENWNEMSLTNGPCRSRDWAADRQISEACVHLITDWAHNERSAGYGDEAKGRTLVRPPAQHLSTWLQTTHVGALVIVKEEGLARC